MWRIVKKIWKHRIFWSVIVFSFTFILAVGFIAVWGIEAPISQFMVYLILILFLVLFLGFKIIGWLIKFIIPFFRTAIFVMENLWEYYQEKKKQLAAISPKNPFYLEKSYKQKHYIAMSILFVIVTLLMLKWFDPYIKNSFDQSLVYANEAVDTLTNGFIALDVSSFLKARVSLGAYIKEMFVAVLFSLISLLIAAATVKLINYYQRKRSLYRIEKTDAWEDCYAKENDSDFY